MAYLLLGFMHETALLHRCANGAPTTHKIRFGGVGEILDLTAKFDREKLRGAFSRSQFPSIFLDLRKKAAILHFWQRTKSTIQSRSSQLIENVYRALAVNCFLSVCSLSLILSIGLPPSFAKKRSVHRMLGNQIFRQNLTTIHRGKDATGKPERTIYR